MQNPKPAPFNVVPGDTTGTTWALPEGALARLGKGYYQQRESEIGLSPDGTYFVIGTRMGLWWYEMSSSSPIALWETERGLISAVNFSPDGKWIAIGNWDGVIKIRDVQSGECITEIMWLRSRHITFSSDKFWIATASNPKNLVQVLDVQNGVRIAEMDWEGHEPISGISRLNFSPDRKHLAATAGWNTYVWPSETGTPIMKFEGRHSAFSPDNRQLTCVTQGDKTLNVWEFGKNMPKMIYSESGPVRRNPFFSLKGELHAIEDRQDTIEVWNVERREKLHVLDLHPESIEATTIKRYPQLTLSDTDADIPPHKKDKCRDIHKSSILGESVYPVGQIRFSPDGQTLACIDGQILACIDGQTLACIRSGRGVVLWDVVSKEARKTLLMKEVFINSFTFRPDGGILAVSSYRDRSNNQRTVNVWDADKPDEPIAEFEIDQQMESIGCIVFTPIGDRFAGRGDDTIYVWNFKQKEKLERLTGHTDFIRSLAISPDGKRLASGSWDKTARLWDVESGEQIATLSLDEPCTTMGIKFSPSGKIIAGGIKGEIRLWSAENPSLIRTIPQPENNQRVYALAFSPCGRYLASGTWWQKGMEKMAIRLWDVETGENIHTFWGHTTDVQSLAFSPDGTLLASGGFDGTILLWDVKPFINSN